MKDNGFSALDDSLVMTNGLYVYSHCLINSSEDTPHILTIVSDDKLKIYDKAKVFGFVYDNLIDENVLYACSHYFDVYADFDMLTEYEISRNLIRRNSYDKGVVSLFRKADYFAKDASLRRAKSIEQRLAA
jgi:hypothetical protein